ncbi:YchJ family protein [Arsukibacterium sp.]|uniref:YchJ family protein n=1 Tax=Arsukibacterium sp. TaxID=1977258 RepID=UPI002FD902EB
MSLNCYCCSKLSFAECCEPVLTAKQYATSPLQLMRSRYSAYCLKQIDYLVQTQHASGRTVTIKEEITAFAEQVHFVALDIIKVNETNHTVSFIARYISGNKLETLAETSNFVFEHRWYYTAGVTEFSSNKINRNDTCPCGSGKKFKQCHQHLASAQA